MTEARKKPAGSGKPRSAKPASARPGGTTAGSKPSGKPGAKSGSRTPGGKPGERSGKPSSGKPAGRGSKPGERSGKPGERTERSPRPPRVERGERTERPERSDRPGSTDRTRSGRPPAGRTSSGERRSASGKPAGERKAYADRKGPAGPRKPGGGRPRTDDRLDTRRPQRSDANRPRDPHIPDDITPEMLDKGLLFELRTLPEGLAEIVARHLVAADNALVEGDITLARAHIAAAKRRAGRVAPVREAAGIAAYLDGDYTEAIAELRTVRRMTGADEYVPMLADCERGLGRPQRALELLKEVDQRKVSPETRVEMTLVAAGARADLGQIDAALVLLQIPELTKLPKGGPRARLQYAYADLLERAGRIDESREWMRKAATSDIDGVTDAEERVEEAEGLLIFEEEEFELEGGEPDAQ